MEIRRLEERRELDKRGISADLRTKSSAQRRMKWAVET